MDVTWVARKRGVRILIAVAAAGFALLNLLAWRQARAMLVFAAGGGAATRIEDLRGLRKLWVLVAGVRVPRPENVATPASLGLAFTTQRAPVGAGGGEVELWLVPCAEPRGVVVLIPGYKAAKDSLLAEAAALHAMGYACVLADVRGCGGSSGHTTTLGVREAEDVVAAHAAAVAAWPGKPVVLYGFSMGGAAVLRAVAEYGLVPDAIIVECVFDRMLNALRTRFAMLGLPPFPAAELLALWGGGIGGFNGFRNNPVTAAAAVHVPALVCAGAADRRATADQVRRVYDALAGPKRYHLFAGGHESFAATTSSEWPTVVGEFLSAYATPRSTGVAP